MAQATQRILQVDGCRGLYRGLVPTLLLIAPQTGFQFGFYSLFTSLWDSAFKPLAFELSDGLAKSMVCGALAGLCAKTAVYPLDLVKKRLQVQGFGDARKAFGQTSSYRGLVHCLKLTIKEEGVVALFKGLKPSLIKAMLSVGLHFSVYEQSLKLLRIWHLKHNID